MRQRTRNYSIPQRRIIFDKTQGVCHFCGDAIEFERYDLRREGELSTWSIDHIKQIDKGGADSIENCLPVCVTCNRLRWQRTGVNLREALFLGIIVMKEINTGSELGKRISELREKRLAENRRRRKPNIELPVT